MSIIDVPLHPGTIHARISKMLVVEKCGVGGRFFKIEFERSSDDVVFVERLTFLWKKK